MTGQLWGQVTTGYRTMIIASTKQVSFLLAVQINSSLKYQDSNNIFGDEVKKATFWSQNVFYLIMFLFCFVCFASAESPLMEVQHHFSSALFHRSLYTTSFIPAQKVVIKDFSTAAVESFLKFLYSGTIDMPVERLVEVSAIADKYQIMELKKLCLTELQDSYSKILKTNLW